MTSPTILVVEDDAPIRRGVVDVLAANGYEVLAAADGREGMEKALTATIDLILLDLVLPHADGFSILEQVNRSRPGLPVIILSARGEENDRVRGLKLGADDYVVKPFSVRELLARVEAVLRRSPERGPETETIAFAGGEVDLVRSEVRFDDGSQATLSEREGELLRYLASHSGRPVSREELLRRVWRLDPKHLETRTVDMHIAHLRGKLKDADGTPRTLVTVRGKGYMFVS